MKKIFESEEPWKKKEPGARLSQKAVKDQRAMERQRRRTERALTQQLIIECNKDLFGTPGLYKSFTLRVKIPLRKDEIENRMKAAFPELPWESL